MKINKYKIEVAMARNGYDPQDLAKASGLSASCVYNLMHQKNAVHRQPESLPRLLEWM